MIEIGILKTTGKMRKVIFIAFFAVSVMWMFTLYDFSSMNSEESAVQSNEISDKVVETVAPAHEKPKEYVEDDFYYVVNNFVRKVAHVVSYAILGMLTYFAAGVLKWLPDKVLKPAFVSVPVCVVFAISDEMHQTFVDGRFGRPMDVIIDAVGVLVGTLAAVLAFVIYSRVKKHMACKKRDVCHDS